MSLIDRLLELRDASLSSMDDTHDFFAHTAGLWRLAQVESKRGKRLKLVNQVTGSNVTERNVPGLAQKYVTQFIADAALQRLWSLFESFVFGFLLEWYLEYPKNLSAKQLTLDDVIQIPIREDVIREVISRHLQDLAYQPMEKWFRELDKIANLAEPSPDAIDILREVKASRDVLTHNKGMVNSLYLVRSGAAARFGLGEQIQLSDEYLQKVHQLMRTTATRLTAAAIPKLT